MMYDFELPYPRGLSYKVGCQRSRLMRPPIYIPPPETYIVQRGMTEHDAKQKARGMTKSRKHPGRYKAERCGRTWNLIRTE